MMRSVFRRAFTLVELLVVITIIGILIALLLPAVQAAREAARRSACTNNLKQIGLALHMHHDARTYLPYGHKIPLNGNNNSELGESTWILPILRYMEQQSLYDKVDATKGFGSANPLSPLANNFPVTSSPISAFECPSSRKTNSTLWWAAYARGSYVANNGIGPMTEWTTAAPTRVTGVFYVNSQTCWADFADGTSNTALVSEINVVPGGTNGDQRGVFHYPEGPLYHHNYTPNSMVPDRLRAPNSGCTDDPQAPCVQGYTAWNNRALVITARSRHPGGVNLLLGDGSVRFVGNSVAINVWQPLCTPTAKSNAIIPGDESFTGF